MRKKSLLFVLMLTITLVAGSCGKSGSEDVAADQKPAATTEAAAESDSLTTEAEKNEAEASTSEETNTEETKTEETKTEETKTEETKTEETKAEDTELTEAGTEDTSSKESTLDEKATENKEAEKEEAEMEKDWYELALEKSIMSTGNNERLKKVIEKARSGETVNIATLGGSVTEGALADPFSNGYAYLFANSFQETYCSGDNINFVNAGVSGTPSALGVMRYQRSVVDALGTEPDLLIIEFAVNDWQEATGGKGYESLIYEALSENEDCAVILLFAVSKGKWNLQNDMKAYGKYYSLPMVSMLDAVTSTEELPDDTYFADEYHPTSYGHVMMKDCLMKLLETVDNADVDASIELPQNPKKGRQFMDMKLVNDMDGIKVDKGAFSATDTVVQTDYFSKKCVFADNFMKEAGEGEPFSVTLTCSQLLIDYKISGDSKFGNAEVYVDGELVTTLEGYAQGGWNNHTVALLLDTDEAAEHSVTVKMASGDETKKFTIYAMSYK